MSLYGFALFVHVIAAIVLVGWNAAAHLTVGLMRRAQTVDGLRAHIGWLGAMSRTLAPVSALVLVAGLYLTFAGNWWAAGWPVVSLVLFVLSGVAASTLVDPAVRRLQQTIAATPDGPATPEVLSSLSDPRLTRTTWALAGGDLAIVFLMTNKPGWSLAIVVAVGGVALGLAAGSRAVGRAAPAPATVVPDAGV